jgi:Tol biopolymer transport system component
MIKRRALAVLGLAVLTATPWSFAGPAHAAFPGTNGRLAFVQVDGDAEAIWVMEPDGSEPTALTDTGLDSDPAWSPDGGSIAFTSARDGNYEIYVMDADGSNQRRLTDDAGSDRQPEWSPDG